MGKLGCHKRYIEEAPFMEVKNHHGSRNKIIVIQYQRYY